ncbi:hypothetical protein DFJ74DRAFT_479625 [Hyaloraphidium curvatum]|nr:hypothetical protein DFJ74DRAFT_479625 [Hyaloraphidium curvatum]
MSAPAPGPASPPSTPPKPAVPAAQPAGAPPTTVVPAPAQGTPPQAAPVAQQPTPSPTPAPAIPQAKPAVPAAQPAPAAAAPAAAQQPPPASQPAAAQTPAAIPQAKPAVPQAAPSAAPAAAAPASPPQAQPAPGGIPQAKPAVPQPPAAAPAATAAAVPQAKPAVPAAQPAPAAAAPTPAQQPPPATPAPSTPAPAAPAGVVPQAKPAVPQAKPAAPPAAKPADTAVARSDTAASGKDDAPKEEAGPAKVETSLLDKFIADETWEKNEILKWMGPWLQQVERGIMLFGSGAFAWLLGRTGWSFAWVMFVFLATVPAWDRSLKVAFQRMKALARYEVLHSRLETDWESMDWFNYFFQKFWYQLEPDISKTAIQAVNTQLEAFKPSFISSLVLSEFTLGSQPPVIKAVKSFPRVSGDDRAQVMFHVEWTPLTQEDLIAERVRQERIRSAIKTQAEQDGGGFSKDMQNSKIVLMAYVGAGAAKVGVPVELKNVALEGQFIVRFKFGPQVPYIQTVNAWFPDEYGPPAIDFELQPLKSVNVLDVPLLSGAIQNAIKGTLESMLKYPGYKVDLTGLAAPPTDAAEWAAGVLRMTIISARNLPNVDMFSGASDPYCKILMGVTGAEKVLGQTRIIKDNANPLWNESTYALVPNSVLSAEGISTGADNIRFEVMDWNDKSAHEFIGITKKMRIAEFIRSGKAGSLPEDRKKEMAASWGTPDSLSPVWQPLTKRDDVRALRGDLQIDMCWAVAEALDEKNKDTKSGIVRVTIHQAAELVAFGGIANFTPYISFQVGGKEVFRTPKKKSTINPSYTQTFEVYYHDISQSSITAIVKHGADFRDDPTIGDATIKISDAIARKPGDDWFKLFKCVPSLAISFCCRIG